VYWLPTAFASFPFISPPVRHRVPSHFNRILPYRPQAQNIFFNTLFSNIVGKELENQVRQIGFTGYVIQFSDLQIRQVLQTVCGVLTCTMSYFRRSPHLEVKTAEECRLVIRLHLVPILRVDGTTLPFLHTPS